MYSLLFYLSLTFLTFLQSLRYAGRYIQLLLASIIFYFFVSSKGNQDYQAYLNIFESPEGYSEIGYVFLVNSVKFFDGSHTTILLILGLIVSSTFMRLSQYSKVAYLSIFCYMIFPMPVDIIQVRNTFSTFLIINSLLFLGEKKPLRALSSALLGVLLHYAGMALLAIFAFSYIIRKTTLRNSIKIVILLSIAISVGFDPLLKLLLSLDYSRTLSSYLAEEGKILSVLIWGGGIVASLLIFSKLINSASKETIPLERWQLINLIYKAILTSLVFLPAVYYLYEFNRIYRGIFILNYIFGSLIHGYLTRQNKIILWGFLISLSSVYGAYYAAALDYDYILFGL